MASSSKTVKEKPLHGSPRLLPRPTAASAARAARNATNRNLTQAPPQRQSPTRASISPAPSKTRNITQRKNESKSDIRINPENVLAKPDNKDQLPQVDSYILIENASVVAAKDTPDPLADITDETHQEIHESDVLAMKTDELIELQNGQQSPLGRAESPHLPSLSSRPQTPKSLPSSRPQTPHLPSRPATPHPSSRPTTPRVASRPTTPAHPAQRRGTPASRPNTPLSPTRPTTPTKATSPLVSLYHDAKDDDIKNTFAMKQKEFQRMKKELDLKQQAVLEVFDSLQSLRERMPRERDSACGEGHLQELVVFNVADWTADEVSQLCRDAVASSATEEGVELFNTTTPIDECALAELDAKVLGLPHRFADLCLQAFTARQELIDWVKGLIENNVIKEENGDGECLKRIARYNDQGLDLCEALREVKGRADDAVATVIQLSRRACRERGALVTVGESLVREIARLRQDIEARSAVVNEMRGVPAETETSKTFDESQRELQQEKVTRNTNKEKLATTESQLRQARARVTKMDRQLREAEATISSLTSSVKSLEDQSRQREVQLEARARKLKESLKTGEVTSGHLAQQRDALQSQIIELKEQLESLTTQHKSAIQELTNQLKLTKTAFEEQRIATEQEKELKETAETDLVQSQNIIEDLKTKITELENSRPNSDLPTEREMDLWAELQATKDTLRITEDEVTACKREKVRFLENLTKTTESDGKVGMQHKLAAELLSKEEILGKMQMQIRDLTKNIKLNEQKVIQYEQYVRNLQAHNRAVANCQETPNGISYQDLQQEIMKLKMTLLEAVHRNEELSERLMQKEQQIEQQDKTSRAQARVIKVNKQIAAKAEEIQELFATLENKQQQIHRLEKIVLALEEQQRRAQAQRTRHEEKIAALEHELAAGGNRRERKFLFF